MQNSSRPFKIRVKKGGIMNSVEMETTIKAPSADVWQTVSDFNGLKKLFG